MSLTAVSESVGIELNSLGALVSAEESTRRRRIVDATVGLVVERGVRSLSLEEVASRAGISRATLYRWFPGGREELFDAALATEVARFFSSLSAELSRANSAEETCVEFLVEAARRLDPESALAMLLAERTGTFGAAVTFEGLQSALEIGSDFLWPFYARQMEPDAAGRAAELTVRVGLSYLFGPDGELHLSDRSDVEALVARHVAPSLEALSAQRANEGR